MNILIEDVTDNSLSLSVLAGDVVRWQRTVTKENDSFLLVSDKQYGFAEIKAIWEAHAAQLDEDGKLLIPFPTAEQLV